MLQPALFAPSPVDLLDLERQEFARGFRLIAGIDEAGRGALAGPVVAAAVILPEGIHIKGVNDSKKLSSRTREQLFDVIMHQALAVASAEGSHELIDRVNILQATRITMLEAVNALRKNPDFLLIDGITTIQSVIPQRTIKKGDSLSLSIAAASIIAKVTRDRLMRDFDVIYPGYDFATHKGYGSASHMDAIRRLGPSPIHRRTFGGVKEHIRCPSF